MQKIYEKNSGDLIATLPRTVDTFPSGLVRVNQVYVGRSDLNSTHRQLVQVGSTLPSGDNSPSIEPLRIFPEVAETKRSDGFTEYSVTAYGRANAIGQTSFPITFGTDYGGYAVRFPFIRITVPTSSLILPTAPTFIPDFIFSDTVKIKKLPAGSSYAQWGPNYFGWDSNNLGSWAFRTISEGDFTFNQNFIFYASPLSISSSQTENYGQFDELSLNFSSNLIDSGFPGIRSVGDDIGILDKNRNTLTNLYDLFTW